VKDYLVKAFAYSKTIRLYAAITTNLVEDARKIHDTWPAATAAFGRTLTAALIMGALLKGDQSLVIQIDGKGPIGKIIALSNANGEVKGMVSNPRVHLSTNEGKLAVGKVVGSDGFLRVTKDLKVKDIYTSSAKLQTGEIGDDLAYYFAMSEQTPSSVGLGVLVSPDGNVLSSGGFILQVLPGVLNETINMIEKNISIMKPISDLLFEGYSPEDLISEITKGNYEIIESLDVKYVCDCTVERFAKGLISLGEVELQEMIDKDEMVEVVCQFCNKKYDFSITDLQKLKLEAMSKK